MINRQSRYTKDDVEWLRVLCEGYDEDSEMYGIYLKAANALDRKNYNIRFTRYQKEILSYKYENKEYLTDGESDVLYKILGF